MKTVHRSFAILAVLALCLAAVSLVPLSAAGPIQVRGPAALDTEVGGPFVSEPVTPQRIDLDLRSLPAVEPWQPGDPVREIPRVLIPRLAPETGWPQPARPSPDPLLALQASTLPGIAGREFSTPTLNFEGIPYTGVHPPDTVGDVGPDHYIQTVNGLDGTLVIIFDKTGAVVAGPFYLDSLWPGGDNCASGWGDPIVLYDALADRWLLSEFAPGNHLCVYVSQTPDPVSGGWYGYDFQAPNFPDYPKYAVWPDAYYVSSNESLPAVYALDRSQMLTGGVATYQRFTAPPLQGFPFQALIPSDLDGASPPPVGAPNYFMRHRDDEVHNPGSNDPNYDFLEVWEFHVDFDNPGNSSFAQALDIAVTEFDSHLCGLISFYCFPQPGTNTTLDPLREVVMWRLQYRNFGDHETLVGNLVTDVDGTDHGGIRWFELRQTEGNPWALFQEGTYAPDAAHRWMGSIAMDGSGNMALGYSVSDAFSIYPSIRYVGRLASDPLGTMPQGEYTIIDGSGFQSPSTRWGDYSAMSVDPADDCTFWYTNEYLPPSGNWQTRIAAFQFPECGNPDFTLEANPDTLEVCAPDIVTSTIQVGQVLSYAEDVTLEVLNVPTGVTADIVPMVVTPPGEATLTLEVGDATADGEYTLIVSGTAQLTNVHTVEIVLMVSHGPEVLLTSDAPVELGQPMHFTATITGTEPFTVTWNFGDGSPVESGVDLMNVTHVYTQAGDYQITLSAENGCDEAVVTDTVTVIAPCEPVGGPGFTWAPEAPLVGETVSFSATAPLTGTPPFTVTWNFGDGSPEESGVDLMNVTHVYTQGGDYEVILSAENPCGQAVVTDTLTIEPAAPPTYYIYLPLVRK